MDQYLSAVIITLITGVFSVLTLIIQKRNNETIDKIDEQNRFIERERRVKKSLNEKIGEREELMDEMILLILETNLYALNSSETPPEVFTKSESLKARFKTVTDEMVELNKEYSMILELSQEYTDANKK